MRRRIDPEEGFTDGEVVERWSKKKILIALAVLLVLGVSGIFLVGKIKNTATKVLGTESGPRITTGSSLSTENIRLPTKEDADKLLDQAKQELSTITSESLNASQAGNLQKVIEDLQNIKSGSAGAVGVFCDLVCKK